MLNNCVGKVLAMSSIIETPAWGYESDNTYLNMGVNVNTSLTPEEIVAELKNIERAIDPDGNHRNDAGEYADRMIDLDLICLDDEVVSSAMVEVPHRLMTERQFVLTPMEEILPEWVHPTLRLRPSELLERLNNKHAFQNVFK